MSALPIYLKHGMGLRMSHNKLSTTSINKLSQWLGNTGFAWEKSNITEGFYHSLIDIDDKVTLSVEVAGNPDNPPLLLVMGLGSQMIFWPDSLLFRLLDAGFFIIRFDNRDIGLSSKFQDGEHHSHYQTIYGILKMMLRMQLGLSNKTEPVAYTLIDMAEDTIKLIRKLKLNKVNLMGASMGGMISQIVSAQYPQEIANLILLFTSSNRPFLPPPKAKQVSVLFSHPRNPTKIASINHAEWFIRTIGSPGFVNSKLVRQIAGKRFDRSVYPRGSVQQLTAILATGSLRKYSKKITAPTLVLHGDKDGLIPASAGKDIAKTINNAKFTLVEGMGHDLPDYYQSHMVKLIKEHCGVD